jgi:hypothetical protein
LQIICAVGAEGEVNAALCTFIITPPGSHGATVLVACATMLAGHCTVLDTNLLRSRAGVVGVVSGDLLVKGLGAVSACKVDANDAHNNAAMLITRVFMFIFLSC